MLPGQLVECNLKNNFLEKLYTKCDGESIARPLSKKNQNWAYLWINILKFYMVFLVWQVEDYRKWLKLSCSSLTFTSYKTSLRNKRWPETSLYASFSARFLKKKNKSVVIFFCPTKFKCLVAFGLWDIWQIRYFSCLLPRLWCHTFWNQSVFIHHKKVKAKI